MGNIGHLGQYDVSAEYIEKRSFIHVERKAEDGTTEEVVIPVMRKRKNVYLQHVSGETIMLSAYVHQGQIRFKGGELHVKIGRRTAKIHVSVR